MLKIPLIISCFYVIASNAILYDSFTGKPVNKTLLKIYETRKNIEICTIEIKPCEPNQWRRVDGSCTNPKYPSRGTHRTPSHRVLAPVFSSDYEPRKAVNGGPLPLARKLRTELLSMGKASERSITQLASYYMIFMFTDLSAIHEVANYIINIETCCIPEGQYDNRCIPLKIPVDDPVHRYSGVRCMNLTRPLSYQTYGCLDNGTTFERMVIQTPLYDLSQTYNPTPGVIDHIRTYKNGLMIEEEEDGQLFPPTDPDSHMCLLNQPPRENRCFKYHINNVMSSNLMNILFYRQHNQIARELYRLNPSWDDERLFYTARDINMAISVQIFFYELLPIIMGKKNMIRDGIIGDGGFRDLYDESVEPRMSDEYVYGLRWFHLIQETDLKLHDKNGHYVRSFPLVNGTTRTGFLAIDNNMQHIIQGSFRQLGGKFDQTIDYDMADRILGGILHSSDVTASDIEKGRYYGLQPYVNYKEFCTKKKYRSFADLEDSFSFESLNRLMKVYKDPRDIDLIAGLWGEKYVKGGKIPETLYCLLVEQLKRTVQSDRHWYERHNRPRAFTEEQLKAIRQVTIAGTLCYIGDFVTEIQPRAFYAISNELYDKNGHYVRSFPIVNGTTRTGFFAVDNNMQHFIQGSFRQLGGRFDQAIDYDMADRILGSIFFSADVAASDLKKGRYFGLQPYVNYKEFCTNKKYRTFEDLKDSFSFERLDRLMEVYKDPKDIDLMAALWGEKHIKGGKIPATLYCLFADQLTRTLKSDRHWYERPNRPHAFTKAQLKAIRKVTIAGVLCSIGDLVSEIQPHAFYSISSDNPLTKCSSSKIGKLDLTAWKGLVRVDNGIKLKVFVIIIIILTCILNSKSPTLLLVSTQGRRSNSFIHSY